MAGPRRPLQLFFFRIQFLFISIFWKRWLWGRFSLTLSASMCLFHRRLPTYNHQLVHKLYDYYSRLLWKTQDDGGREIYKWNSLEWIMRRMRSITLEFFQILLNENNNLLDCSGGWNRVWVTSIECFKLHRTRRRNLHYQLSIWKKNRPTQSK